jgi:hypothetical protein
MEIRIRKVLKNCVALTEKEVLSNANVQGNILEMKMTVFWVVALCSLVKFTDVSEVLAASIIRVPR